LVLIGRDIEARHRMKIPVSLTSQLSVNNKPLI